MRPMTRDPAATNPDLYRVTETHVIFVELKEAGGASAPGGGPLGPEDG